MCFCCGENTTRLLGTVPGDSVAPRHFAHAKKDIWCVTVLSARESPSSRCVFIGCHDQSELYLRARNQSCSSDHSCVYILDFNGKKSVCGCVCLFPIFWRSLLCMFAFLICACRYPYHVSNWFVIWARVSGCLCVCIYTLFHMCKLYRLILILLSIYIYIYIYIDPFLCLSNVQLRSICSF